MKLTRLEFLKISAASSLGALLFSNGISLWAFEADPAIDNPLAYYPNRVFLVVIRISHAYDYAVANQGRHPTGVRIIRRTYPGELAVITVLVTINFFPFTV